MEVIMTLLLCALGLFLYLTDKNNKEVLRLKEELRQRNNTTNLPTPALTQQPQVIREVIVEKPVIIFQPVPPKPFTPVLSSGRIFVSVVFKGSKKYYDYFLGDNYDVNVGDYVEVYARDKNNGNIPRKTVAKVRYISYPGEISRYAKSEIERKVTYNEWLRAS
ncbi:MAG: hypothetical protein IKI08_04005 [Selenomonadaceae bacterium]|nr:hypothetical protein [Selenomonadaceae bacterium]